MSLRCSRSAAPAGLHAVDLARELEMREAIIPPLPGVFSAIGLLVADVRHDYVTALGGIVSTAADADELERKFQGMEDDARQSLRAEGFGDEAIRLVRSADLKVAGQTYELTVPLAGARSLDEQWTFPRWSRRSAGSIASATPSSSKASRSSSSICG